MFPKIFKKEDHFSFIKKLKVESFMPMPVMNLKVNNMLKVYLKLVEHLRRLDGDRGFEVLGTSPGEKNLWAEKNAKYA